MFLSQIIMPSRAKSTSVVIQAWKLRMWECCIECYSWCGYCSQLGAFVIPIGRFTWACLDRSARGIMHLPVASKLTDPHDKLRDSTITHCSLESNNACCCLVLTSSVGSGFARSRFRKVLGTPITSRACVSHLQLWFHVISQIDFSNFASCKKELTPALLRI